MHSLSILSLAILASACFGNEISAQHVYGKPVAEEAPAGPDRWLFPGLGDDAGQTGIDEWNIHERTLVLRGSLPLRYMMFLPSRLPRTALTMALDVHPALPDEVVALPLLEIATAELRLAGRFGLNIARVHHDTNLLINLATLELKRKHKMYIKARLLKNPSLGASFGRLLIEEIARIKPETEDPRVKVLPPLITNLAHHLRKALEGAVALAGQPGYAVPFAAWAARELPAELSPAGQRAFVNSIKAEKEAVAAAKRAHDLARARRSECQARMEEGLPVEGNLSY